MGPLHLLRCHGVLDNELEAQDKPDLLLVVVLMMPSMVSLS